MSLPILSAVLFDLDGTLIDTAPDFIRIIHLLCQEDGVPPPTPEQIREAAGEVILGSGVEHAVRGVEQVQLRGAPGLSGCGRRHQERAGEGSLAIDGDGADAFEVRLGLG